MGMVATCPNLMVFIKLAPYSESSKDQRLLIELFVNSTIQKSVQISCAKDC